MTDLAAVSLARVQEELGAELARWLPDRRWFAGKARTLDGVRVADVAALPGGALVVLAAVRYADGGEERYQVPLSPAPAGDAGLRPQGFLPLRDALDDEAAVRALVRMATHGGEVATVRGRRLVGSPLGDPADVPRTARIERLKAEQSNSSVLLRRADGTGAMGKVFRRLEPGINPDVELTGALTAVGFPAVPAQLGTVELRAAGDDPVALVVLSELVTGAQDGWEAALADARSVASGSGPVLTDHVGSLGRTVGELHAALAVIFGRSAAGGHEVSAWAHAWQERADLILDLAAERAPADAAPVLEQRSAVLGGLGAIAAVPDPGPLIRIHGDLHLGQTLLKPDGSWYVLDFEGEPARSLEQRRSPGPPARDVAGMLRSFDYAVGAVDPLSRTLAGWRDGLRARFLAGYLEVAGREGLLPPDDDHATVVVRAFELDKAVYELGYELANRPGWVPIPVGGILRLLQGDDGQ